MIEFIKKHKWLTAIGGVILLGTVVSAASEPSSSALQQTQTTQSIPYPSKAFLDTPTQTPTQQAQPDPLSNNNSYINSSGNTVHSPAYTNDNSVPAGASARCGDGTYSFSQHRSGTCSHHGGVSSWL